MFNRRGFIAGAAAVVAAGSLRGVNAETAADWRMVAQDGAPGARWDHTLSADDARKRLVLAFGRNASGVALGDCWVADRSDGNWEPLNNAGPSSRFGHAVATDAGRGTVYLFGGQSADLFFNDLWALDLASDQWTQLSDGSGAPPARYGTSLVFDGDRTLLLTHGFTLDGRFDDTWSFDLENLTWEERSPDPDTRPLRRCLHESIWNPATESMWLFGGCSSGYGPCPQGDLWEFNPAQGDWRSVTVAGPTPRSNPALTYDRHTDRLLLVGGLTADGPSAEIWQGRVSGDSVEWGQIATNESPAARSSHDAVTSGGALYLSGGRGVDGVFGDLWRLKFNE